MKGLINAVGKQDSLGKDRSSEVRGLIKLGGRALVHHTLERLEEIGIKETLILTNPNHKSQYKGEVFRKGQQVTVQSYRRNQDPLAVYLAGALMLKEDVLIVADDNVFDFSLKPMIEKFNQVQGSVLSILPIERVMGENEGNLNFGTCSVGKNGRIIQASYSFDPKTKMDSSQRIILDIYAVHRNQIIQAEKVVGGAKDLANKWYSGFYAWEPKEGFWADTGKPLLRAKAEAHFSKKV